jgi:hypothetical protein
MTERECKQSPKTEVMLSHHEPELRWKGGDHAEAKNNGR